MSQAQHANLPDRAERPRRWHLVYYGLAAFDVLTICATLLMTDRLVHDYREAIAQNAQWMRVLERSAALSRYASEMDAPGNDVFESRDPVHERARLEAAVIEFNGALSSTRSALQPTRARLDRPGSDQHLWSQLNTVEARAEELEHHAKVIFTHLAEGRGSEATEAMAAMDRRFATCSAAIAEFESAVRSIQMDVLSQQTSAAAATQRSEWCVAVLILMSVTGVVFYGRRLTGELMKAELERAQHLRHQEKLNQDLEALRDAALAANRAKSVFLANMSHELRTPLNGVLGMTQLLLESRLDDEQMDHARTAHDSGQRLLALLEDVLTYANSEEGRLSEPGGEFSPRELVEQLLESFEPRASEVGSTLTLYCSPRVPERVHGHGARLRTVLEHLIRNALQFGERHEVALSLEPMERIAGVVTLRFEVRDSGPGMSPEIQARVFEPFTQADASATRRQGGAGMGLAVSERLLRMLGGRLEMTSRPGEGTCCAVWMSFEVRAEREASHEPGEPLRILVVDPGPLSRECLHRQLVAWGQRADTAADAASARTRVREAAAEGDPFVLVLSTLPGSDGDAAGLPDAVRRHGGRLLHIVPGAATTGAETVGSLQRGSLPRELSSVIRALERPMPPPAGGRAMSKLVLVIERNPVLEQMLQLQIQRLGHRVQLAPDERAALEAVAHEPYDAVLLSACGTAEESAQCAQRLRSRLPAHRQGVPIVALLGSPIPADREVLLAAGLDHVLLRPCSLAELSAVLDPEAPARPGEAAA